MPTQGTQEFDVSADASESSSNDTPSISRRSVLAGGAGIALSAGLAGCLGDDDDTIQVGFPVPFTGAFALLGESVENGAEMYFEEELGGEIDGMEIEMVSQDTEADPDRGVDIVRDMLQADEVDFLLGPVSSGVALAMAPEVDEADQALWINATSGTYLLLEEHCTPYHFRTAYNNYLTSAPMADYIIEELDRESAYIYYTDYAFGQQHRDFFTERFEELGGEVTGTVGAPLDTDDFSPFFEDIESEDPDVLFAIAAGGDAINFVSQASEFGLDEGREVTGPGFLADNVTFEAQGEAALGVKTVLGYSRSLENDTNQNFIEEYDDTYDIPANQYAVYGYDAAQAVERAVREAGGTDLDDMMDVLRGAQFDTSPRGSFGFHPESQDITNDMYIRDTVMGDDGIPTSEVIETIDIDTPTWGCDLS